MVSATTHSCASGNATLRELNMRAATTRERQHAVAAIFTPSSFLSTSGSARSCKPRTVGGGSPGTPLEASRRGFGNRLFVLHVYSATSICFYLSMLTGLGRTKGKKKKRDTHTKTHAQMRPTHARPRFPSVHPHSGTRADAAWWRRRRRRA